VPGCPRPGRIVDHIVSRRRGGANHPSNLRHLCAVHDNAVKEGADGQRRSGGELVVKGCDVRGRPIDPAHPWNRR
jgi:hypothetical protein